MLLVVAAILVLMVCLFLLFSAIVPPYTGVIISFLGRPVRSAGPGLVLLLRPFEKITHAHFLERRAIPIKMNAETEDEEVVTLELSVEYQPSEKNLIRFLGFNQQQIEEALKERTKSLCSIEIRKRKDRDEVYDNLKVIASAMQADFKTANGINGFTLEEHYGIKLASIMINDPELPPELVQAEVQREIQEKINEKRRLELKEIQSLAKVLVEEARKQGQDMQYQTAFKIVQVQFGIIKENYSHYGLDKDTLVVIKELLPTLVEKLREKDSERPVIKGFREVTHGGQF